MKVLLFFVYNFFNLEKFSTTDHIFDFRQIVTVLSLRFIKNHNKAYKKYFFIQLSFFFAIVNIEIC